MRSDFSILIKMDTTRSFPPFPCCTMILRRLRSMSPKFRLDASSTQSGLAKGIGSTVATILLTHIFRKIIFCRKIASRDIAQNTFH